LLILILEDSAGLPFRSPPQKKKNSEDTRKGNARVFKIALAKKFSLRFFHQLYSNVTVKCMRELSSPRNSGAKQGEIRGFIFAC
jgi:hypothetical protein